MIDTETNRTIRDDLVTALYVGVSYRNSQTNLKCWLPMVRVGWDDEGYYHWSFTQGFKAEYDELFGNILNPQRGYTQTWKDKIIPYYFKGRIPHRADSMKEYNVFGLGHKKGDFIGLLARNGGMVVGDNYDIFPEVSRDESGNYNFYFAPFGLATMIGNGDVNAKKALEQIKVGQELEIKLSDKNQAKIYLAKVLIGYCPSYINYLLRLNSQPYWGNPTAPYALFWLVKRRSEELWKK